MGIFRLERGLVVQRGDRKFAFQRQIDGETIQFEDVLTGAFEIYKISAFLKKVNSGAISICGLNDGCGELGVVQVFRHDELGVTAFKLTEEQRVAWELRCQYVFAFRKRGIQRGQRDRITQLLPSVAERLKDDSPPSASTAMRWMRDFESSGGNTSSLVSGNAVRVTHLRVDDQVRHLITEALRKHYFIRNGDSLRKVYRRLAATFDASKRQRSNQKAAVLSESTVRRIAGETEPYHRDRARFGASYAAAKWRHSTGGVYATRPLQRVEMDHTVLDLYVLDDRRGIPLGRPIVTVLIDGYSGYLLSIYVSFEGGSIGRMAQSIKFALQPKSDLVQAYELTQQWYTPGLWETLVLDNAMEFHSSHARMMSMELCFDLEYCPVRKPWFKPTVERAMLELARILPIPGRPEKFLGVKDVIDPKVKACVMFADLCRCLAKWAVDVYPIQVNDRKLARPLDLLQEGLVDMPPPAFLDDLRSLDVIGGLSRQMKVRHSGIEMHHLTYRSNELAEMAKQISPSFSANIKINADDLGSIWVQNPKSKTWINVPATNSTYAQGLSLFQHKLIRTHAKSNLKSMGATEALLRAHAELQDMWDVAVRDGKKVKANAKQLAALEGMRSSKIYADKKANGQVTAEQIATRQDIVIEPSEIPVFESFDLSTRLR